MDGVSSRCMSSSAYHNFILTFVDSTFEVASTGFISYKARSSTAEAIGLLGQRVGGKEPLGHDIVGRGPTFNQR
jgi:hypothetical protein